jgi:hypothetical protein
VISLDAPKSILETEKTLKTLSSGQMNKKKTQKQTQNTNTKTKNPLGWVKKNGFFSNPAWRSLSLRSSRPPMCCQVTLGTSTITSRMALGFTFTRAAFMSVIVMFWHFYNKQ